MEQGSMQPFPSPIPARATADITRLRKHKVHSQHVMSCYLLWAATTYRT
jgi:hypothetical protein